MNEAAPPNRVRAAPITAALSAVAMLLATMATLKGPGLSPDSVAYLSTGINLAGGDGLRMLGGQSLTIFPPGLPVLAALGEAIGVGAQTTLRIVSITSFGMIVALGNLLLRRVVDDRAIVVGATGLLAVSPVLLGVSKMAWTEPPFIVVTLAFLLILGRVWERRTLSAADTVALSLLCWGGFLLRYAGVALIAVGGLVLLAALRPLDRQALARIAGFGLLSASVPMAWMLRNHSVDGTYLGPRRASPDSLAFVAERTAATVGEWLVPISGASTRSLAMVGAIGAGVAALGLWASARRAGDGQRSLLQCCGLFIGVYVAYLTFAFVTTAFGVPDSRYLSPVYVPGIVIAAAALGVVLPKLSGRTGSVIALAVLSAFVAGELAGSIGDAREAAAGGIGFNSTTVVESRIAAEAALFLDSTAGSVVYSNSPNALWAATGIRPIRFAPRDVGARGLPVEGELEELARHVSCSTSVTYLVWYLLHDGERDLSLAQIKTAVEVESVLAADDGVLFRVTPRSDRRCRER